MNSAAGNVCVQVYVDVFSPPQSVAERGVAASHADCPCACGAPLGPLPACLPACCVGLGLPHPWYTCPPLCHGQMLVAEKQHLPDLISAFLKVKEAEHLVMAAGTSVEKCLSDPLPTFRFRSLL